MQQHTNEPIRILGLAGPLSDAPVIEVTGTDGEVHVAIGSTVVDLDRDAALELADAIATCANTPRVFTSDDFRIERL